MAEESLEAEGRSASGYVHESANFSSISVCNSFDAECISISDENLMAESVGWSMSTFSCPDESDSFAVKSVAMMSQSRESIASQHVEEVINSTFIHEGAAARIYRLRDADNKYNSRTGSIAIKVLSDQLADEKDISRIENEYNVLKHLSSCQAARDALKCFMRDGIVAIYLEWAAGITLNKWIQNAHSDGQSALPPIDNSKASMARDNSDLVQLMTVARNVSKALAHVHDAGIVHNDISPQHIIVDDNAAVKIISFGSATFLPDSTRISYSHLRNDLISLGFLIYGLLSGDTSDHGKMNQNVVVSDNHEFAENNSTNREGNHHLSETHLYSTLVSTVPAGPLKVVMGLIEAKMTNHRYDSANDVCQDLDRMITDSNNFSLEIAPTSKLGQLHFPSNKLYGRDNHISSILNVCTRMVGGEPAEVVLISGYSGTGKTLLVQHVGQILVTMQMQFTSGKFDQFQQAEPLSAIIKAFNSFFFKIIQSDAQSIEQIKNDILAAIGTEAAVMAKVFPCLCHIVGTPEKEPVQVGTTKVQNRFKYLFVMMIRAMATPSHPLVLFLDDLQWADTASLDLIRTMVTHLERKCFIFFGSYRNDEVTPDHCLTQFMKDLSNKNISTTEILLDNVSRESVNELVSDTFSMPMSETKALADNVYRKTSGNILFVTQFLQSLYDEGFLYYSLDSKSWQWDNMAIEKKTIEDDVVKLLTAKILKLSFSTQQALILLSCIGCICSDSTLRLFIDGWEEELSSTKKERSSSLSALEAAIDEGLLNKEGTTYKFAHDQIQSAVYSLIPNNEQGPMHLKIGYLILKNVPIEEEDNILFIAVDQLNRGKMFLDEEMKKQVAELNLRAGQKAMSMAAFSNSATYLMSGISLLSEDCWDKTYSLTLELHNACAEAEFSNGKFYEVGQLCEVILANAKSHFEKLRAYFILIKSLGSQNRPREAIGVASEVLRDLGEQIPTSLSDQSSIKIGLVKSIYLFVKMKDSEFIGLKVMTDSKKMAAMKFLYALAQYCFIARQDCFLVILHRMLDLTFIYGVSKESCAAFAMCSSLMCAHDGGFKASYKIGKMALLLLEKMDAQEYASHVHLNVYNAKGWTEELKLSIMPQYHAYQKGMQIGDIESAMHNAFFYLKKKFLCGYELSELEKEMSIFGAQMAEYKQELTRQAILPFRQAALNLMGHSDNPLKLTGDVMMQDKFVAKCLENDQKNFLISVYILCGWLAYLFGDYKLSSLTISTRKEVETNVSKKKFDWYGMAIFYDCLTCLALARQNGEEDFISEASQDMAKMEKLAEDSACNHQHRILLIQAEHAYTRGDMDIATEKYLSATVASQSNGCVCEEAICNERAGDFFAMQDHAKATHHYGRAIDLYRQWGAQEKVDHLCGQIPL